MAFRIMIWIEELRIRIKIGIHELFKRDSLFTIAIPIDSLEYNMRIIDGVCALTSTLNSKFAIFLQSLKIQPHLKLVATLSK